MKDQLLEILEAVYGHDGSMLHYIAIDGIVDLFKQNNRCNINDEDSEREFALGDIVKIKGTNFRGVVARNEKGVIGFRFGPKWWPITKKGIVKV